jgi:hypothetical protein
MWHSRKTFMKTNIFNVLFWIISRADWRLQELQQLRLNGYRLFVQSLRNFNVMETHFPVTHLMNSVKIQFSTFSFIPITQTEARYSYTANDNDSKTIHHLDGDALSRSKKPRDRKTKLIFVRTLIDMEMIYLYKRPSKETCRSSLDFWSIDLQNFLIETINEKSLKKQSK